MRQVIGGGWQWVELFFEVPHMFKVAFWLLLMAVLVWLLSVVCKNLRQRTDGR